MGASAASRASKMDPVPGAPSPIFGIAGAMPGMLTGDSAATPVMAAPHSSGSPVANPGPEQPVTVIAYGKPCKSYDWMRGEDDSADVSGTVFRPDSMAAR